MNCSSRTLTGVLAQNPQQKKPRSIPVPKGTPATRRAWALLLERPPSSLCQCMGPPGRTTTAKSRALQKTGQNRICRVISTETVKAQCLPLRFGALTGLGWTRCLVSPCANHAGPHTETCLAPAAAWAYGELRLRQLKSRSNQRSNRVGRTGQEAPFPDVGHYTSRDGPGSSQVGGLTAL